MSLKDFSIQNKLGEGAYSTVYKVRRIVNGETYALKKVKMHNLSDKEKQNALNEVRILASLRNCNVIQYKEAFLDESSQSLCIVMEFANNGDLFQRITEHQKKGTLMPEEEIMNIFIQIVKGLKALHDMKIYHRDLKSANVFMNSDGTVKLGDMNVSKVAKKVLLYTQTGTPYYASPEVWKDQPYDSKSDIWSLGCVLYEMTTLKPPFRAEDMASLYKKVIRGYYPKIQACYSQDLAAVIRALLQVEPHFRPSCDKILSMPQIIKKMEDKIWVEQDEGVKFLLQTIKVPKNMHFITERLPKPNYTPLKMMKIDKQKFIQTLASVGQKDQQLDNSVQMVETLPKIGKKKYHHSREDSLQKQKVRQESQESLYNNDVSMYGSDSLQSLLDVHGQVQGHNSDYLIHQVYGNKMVKKGRKIKGNVSSNHSLKPLNRQGHLDIEGEAKIINIKSQKQNEEKLPSLGLAGSRSGHERLPSIQRYKLSDQPSLKKILQSEDLLEELKGKYRQRQKFL